MQRRFALNIDSFAIIAITVVVQSIGGRLHRRFHSCAGFGLTFSFVLPDNDSNGDKTAETDDESRETVVEEDFRMVGEERAFDELRSHL